jgi:Transposase DDE domain
MVGSRQSSVKAGRRAARGQHQRRRAAQRARHEQRRKHRAYQPWRHLTRDQQAVAERLTAGQVDLVTLSGWGIVEQWLAFLEELEFFALLDLEGTGFQRVMIPLARLLLTYQVKILLGIGSINLVPTRLFRDIALLKLIGYTTAQIAAGFCQRGHLATGPMHKNTLADAIERLSAEELETLLNETVKRLVARGCFAQSRGHFALDASDLETTAKYQGAGLKKVTERKVTKRKEVVEIERYLYGFKVLIVYEVRLRLVVAAKVVPINEHESQHSLALVRQAIANLGPGVLQVLLLDRGFLDGETLWTLKHELKIDFVVPAKDNMHVTADARLLSLRAPDAETIFHQERLGQEQQRHDGTTRWPGQVTVVGVAELGSYDQYGDAEHVKGANRKDFVAHRINAVVVTTWEGKAYATGDEPVFLTSLPVQRPLTVLDLYDLRSLIENTAFRELKQGWCLESYPKKTLAAVRGHVLLTLVTFTLANAFRTQQGQALAQHGIRRQRAEAECSQVIVFAGDHYGIFDIEEVFILLGVAPATCLRVDPAAVRRRYRLSPTSALPAAA